MTGLAPDRVGQWSAELAQAIAQPDDSSFVTVARIADLLEGTDNAMLSDATGIQCMLNATRGLIALGHGRKAVKLAARTLSLCRRQHVSEAQHLDSLTNFMIAMAENEAMGAATQACVEGVLRTHASGDDYWKARFMGNLSALLVKRGHHGLARQTLLLNLARTGHSDPVLARRTLSNLAQLALETRQIEEGMHWLDSATDPPSSGSLHDITDLAMRSYLRARLLCAAGRPQEALDLVLGLRERKLPQHSLVVSHVLDMAEGVARIHLGQIDAGLTRLHDTASLGRMLQPAYFQGAKQTMIDALRAAGRHAQAQQELRDLVTRGAQQLVELAADALTRAAMAEPGWRLDDLLYAQAVEAELLEDASGLHPCRVGRLAALIAVALDLPHDTVAEIERAGRLHDIGKCALPAQLLSLREPTADIRALMRRHVAVGGQFLRRCGFRAKDTALAGVEESHERFDGTGYPMGLAGNAISPAGRIVALADAFDVLTHDRPWRTARPLQEAMAEIQRCSGSHFDPQVVDALHEVLRELPGSIAEIDAVLVRDAIAEEHSLIRAWRELQGVLDHPPTSRPAALH
jgi:HD-GYP domain-containing protein (c-di-GMP phosphodiesterase class II)